MNAELPAPKQDFIGLDDTIHLATGGEPPLLQAHRQSFEKFAKDKAGGVAGYNAHWQVVDRVREQVAEIMALQAGDIALIGNASEGIVRVLSSIDWRAGDNVVVSALDYASGRYALSGLQGKGVELRLVPADGWRIAEEDLIAAADGGTRLIYVSQINALTGQHLDMAALSAAFTDTQVILLADASHAFGVVPVPGDLCDFTVTACYKFALGIHEGILAWNRQRQPRFYPFGTGWHGAKAGETPDKFVRKHDAQRLEFGNAGHLGAYLLRDSLDYLQRFGISAVAAHARRHCRTMVEGMRDLGLDVLTPQDPQRIGASAAFRCLEVDRLVAAAAADGVLVWGDNQRLRASAHLFTTDEDIAFFLACLPKWLDAVRTPES